VHPLLLLVADFQLIWLRNEGGDWI